MQQHNLNSSTNIWQKNQIETKTNNNQSKQTQKTKDVQHRPYQKHRVWHMSALFPKLKEKKSLKKIIIFRILCEFFWTKFKRLDLINMTYMYFTLKYLLYMPLLQLFLFLSWYTNLCIHIKSIWKFYRVHIDFTATEWKPRQSKSGRINSLFLF